MIANVSSSSTAFEDTFTTLKYANEVKKICNVVKQECSIVPLLDMQVSFHQMDEFNSQVALIDEQLSRVEALQTKIHEFKEEYGTVL